MTMPPGSNYFLQTIIHLRRHEEVIIYDNLLSIETFHTEEVSSFLEKEYEKEKYSFPCTMPPEFSSAAATWSARTIYLSAQLLLHREHKNEDLSGIFLPYNGDRDASAQLSADLCLRFLPGILHQLVLIDPDDSLVPILRDILKTWHFSGISYNEEPGSLDFDVISGDRCLQQVYVDRVIEYKNTHLAKHPALASSVKASLGMFADIYWKELKNPD